MDLLRAESDYFKNTFHVEMKEKKDNKIVIPTVNPCEQQDMECFIKCLEKGTSHGMLSNENVVPLLILSNQFQTPWFFEACQAYIIKNLDQMDLLQFLKDVVIPHKFSEMLLVCTHFLSKNIDSLSSEQIQEIKKIAKNEGLVNLSFLC